MAQFSVKIMPLPGSVLGENQQSLIIVFVLSWNNYTVSIFLAGRHWITLPLQLRAYLQYEYEPFVAAMSTILILTSIVLLVIVDRTVGLGGVKKQD